MSTVTKNGLFQLLSEATKSIKDKITEKNKTAAQNNFEKRWELAGFQKPSKKIKEADGVVREFSLGHSYVNQEGKRIEIQVPIWKSKNFCANKYDNKAIRAKQLKESLKGQTHFSDGTPIVQSQLVDAWA